MARVFIIQLIAGVIGSIIASGKGRNAAVWFMLCFIIPLLTLVVSFLPSLKAGNINDVCPSCRRTSKVRDGQCRHCGYQKPVELVQCSGCGNYLPEGERCSCRREGGG